MESGPEHPDAVTLAEWAQGSLTKEDEQVKDYFVKQFQKKNY